MEILDITEIREMQIEATARCLYPPAGVAEATVLTDTVTRRAGRRAEQGPLGQRWGGCRRVRPLWKQGWWFPIKLNIHLAYNSVIPRLGAYSREIKFYSSSIRNHQKLEATQMPFSR